MKVSWNPFAVLLSITMLLLFTSCASTQKTAVIESPKVSGIETPKWFLTPPSDEKYLYAATTATSRDLQLAINKAATDARVEIGRQVELRVQGFQKKFDEETGMGKDAQLLQMYTQATKSIISTSLSGSRINDQKFSEEKEGIYRAFVLIAYPIGAVGQELVNQIKSKEQLYTRFRASETFKEMNEDVQRYEEWKNKQGQ